MDSAEAKVTKCHVCWEVIKVGWYGILSPSKVRLSWIIASRFAVVHSICLRKLTFTLLRVTSAFLLFVQSAYAKSASSSLKPQTSDLFRHSEHSEESQYMAILRTLSSEWQQNYFRAKRTKNIFQHSVWEKRTVGLIIFVGFHPTY